MPVHVHTRSQLVDFTRREHRVLAALGLVVSLSAIDLGLTLDHMSSCGLYEANPLVRLLVERTHSAWLVAVFKVVSLGVCVGTLACLRRHKTTEVAAWLATAVLVWLTVQWYLYCATDIRDLLVEGPVAGDGLVRTVTVGG